METEKKTKKHSVKKTKTEEKREPSKKPAKKKVAKEAAPALSVPAVHLPAESVAKESAPDIGPEKSGEEMIGKPERYWEAVGRRKKAIARVRLYTRGEKSIAVNNKPYGEYFHTKEQQRLAEDSLQKMKSVNRFRVSARVSGGGLKAQAEAIRHGIARALVKFNPDFRKRLRRAGFLTRDPRMKERKKFGLKSARRRPQWAKR